MRIRLLFTVIFWWTLNNSFAQPPSAPKIVRASFQGNHERWRINLTEGGTNRTVRSASLSNFLAGISLCHGDLIILNKFPSSKTVAEKSAARWLSDYCFSNKVALYVYPHIQSTDGSPTIPLYHWVTPFSNPRTLTNAWFYYEGKLLGRARDGFDKMLARISETKPRKILVLGGLYNMKGNFGPFERPYEHEQREFDRVLSATGTELLLSDPLPGL